MPSQPSQRERLVTVDGRAAWKVSPGSGVRQLGKAERNAGGRSTSSRGRRTGGCGLDRRSRDTRRRRRERLPAASADSLEIIRQEVAACRPVRRAGLDPHANRLWRGQSARAAVLPGRSARRRRRPPGRAVRRPGRPTADQDHRGLHAQARGRLHSQRAQVPPAGQPHARCPHEVANCRGFLDRQLALIQPEFICCLGAVAAQTLLETDTTIGRLRGKFHRLPRHRRDLHLSPGLPAAQSGGQERRVGRHEDADAQDGHRVAVACRVATRRCCPRLCRAFRQSGTRRASTSRNCRSLIGIEITTRCLLSLAFFIQPC